MFTESQGCSELPWRCGVPTPEVADWATRLGRKWHYLNLVEQRERWATWKRGIIPSLTDPSPLSPTYLLLFSLEDAKRRGGRGHTPSPTQQTSEDGRARNGESKEERRSPEQRKKRSEFAMHVDSCCCCRSAATGILGQLFTPGDTKFRRLLSQNSYHTPTPCDPDFQSTWGGEESVIGLGEYVTTHRSLGY